jgi:hypothetical protein
MQEMEDKGSFFQYWENGETSDENGKRFSDQ